LTRSKKINKPATLEELPELLKFVERNLSESDVSPSIYFDLKLAVEEACVNIINHGYGEELDGRISLTFIKDDRSIQIEIHDKAPCFDPSGIDSPDLESDWDKRQPGGLGWHLIKSLTDQVDYVSDHDKGNTLTIVKHLNS